MKKMICIHAHASNIPYLIQVFQNHQDIHLAHYVLTDFLENFTTENITEFIEEKVTEDVTNVIITCTMYSNLLQQDFIKEVPILRVEDPLVAHIVANSNKKKLIFSNPKTVEQSMKKVETVYSEQKRTTDYDIFIVPNAFDLIMRDQKEAYQRTLIDYLQENNRLFTGDIYLMQFSMAIVSNKQIDDLQQPIFTILDTLNAVVNQI
ncbi:hypothetical protein [Enterococcus crotali]|uniref:hypothetical protein n=1 Tax=Enterococcus crotali TaxID=1453587 RepID=UPI0004729985|nr:hypothetical protein [Enterococcus crotali]